MKNSKPVYFVIGGSAIIFVMALLILLVIDYRLVDLPFWLVLSLPFVLGVSAFFIFYIFVERFVNERLRIIYRSIRKGKFTNKEREHLPLTNDIFQKVEAETRAWAQEQSAQISRLKEQEKFRREFLGNLAHELKTPLFSIQGYILTLLDGGLEDEEVNRKFLEKASLSIDRMVNLLVDLDSITKMEISGLRLDMVDFDIKESVDKIFESLELKASEKNIQLLFSKDYSDVLVHGDQAKIEQVLLNLIANSIYYGNEGGTTKVRFFEMNDLVLIEISDDGPGIDQEHLPRLFERFYRVEKSRTRNEGGSGLGLAISKHIIEAHRQTLSVRSSVGLGSTFAFSLDKAGSRSERLVTSRGVKIR
ncbi:MAG: sensor histidine kinase [Bacteroidetes bacterium]|nr:MAG: sensor histidine kinase [Bacteroidota bacterium]